VSAVFSFHGAVSSSKSLMNRAQIVRSYEPGIDIIGESSSDDVSLMKRALVNLTKGINVFECGEAGTVLRFLIMRLSREKGEWYLKGRPRLLSRPMDGLTRLLTDLGVTVEFSDQGIHLISDGWKVPDRLEIDAKKSSQFATGLLLNAWNLPKDLHFSLSEQQVSGAYFSMTVKLVEHFGMKVKQLSPREYVVAANTQPQSKELVVEPDLSSCFALVACAALGGQLMIDNFPENSWQPDGFFLKLLEQMQIPFRQTHGQLVVGKTDLIKPIECDLTNTPDLFPVLAVLLARADGVSRITGIEHLVYKESNRLENVVQMLKLLKRDCSYSKEQFKIFGKTEPFEVVSDFDPDQDHRMAMAAQAANFAGAQLNIKDKFVVKKSFPEFWESLGAPCTP
jgi:3-phosphoshikimate 1-carboxyvinyltransferase